MAHPIIVNISKFLDWPVEMEMWELSTNVGDLYMYMLDYKVLHSNNV